MLEMVSHPKLMRKKTLIWKEKERKSNERRPKARQNLASTMARRKISIKLIFFTAMSMHTMQPSVYTRNLVRSP